MKYNELISCSDLPDPDGEDDEYCLDEYNDIWRCMREPDHLGLHADFYDDGPDIPVGYVRVAKTWGRATQAIVPTALKL